MQKIAVLYFCTPDILLVPKPRLGNALAGEAPRLPVTGDGTKPGLGNEEKFFIADDSHTSLFRSEIRELIQKHNCF